MSSKLFRAVILGPPASGKGTISSRIVKTFNLSHVSSGDALRLNIKNKTALGLEAQKYINAGKFVPDPLMVQFILKELKVVGDHPWLLDGFPRTLVQAESLWKEEQLDIALNLNVPFEVIVERAKSRWIHLGSGRVYNNDFNAPKIPGKDDITGEDLIQREDDKPDVVLKRLKDYEKLTQPVIDYYREMNILREFSGRTSDEIWPQVLDCLVRYLPVRLQQVQ